jgi:hypothetical protein
VSGSVTLHKPHNEYQINGPEVNMKVRGLLTNFNDQLETQNTALRQTEQQENAPFSELLPTYLLIAKKQQKRCLAVTLHTRDKQLG